MILDTQPKSSRLLKFASNIGCAFANSKKTNQPSTTELLTWIQLSNKSYTTVSPSTSLPFSLVNAKDPASKQEGNITPAEQQEAEKKGKKQKGGDNNNAA